MRAAVRSVAARSVAVRRAGSALTIGAATSELSQIIALLRSVGGSLYMPGPTNRVAADGSGAPVVDGDVVGHVPDLVGSGNALTQATTANKPLIKRVPILGPELVVNGSGDNTAGWLCPDATVATVGGEFVLTAVNSAYPAMFRAFPTVVGKKYLVSGDMRNGTATTSIAVYPIPQQGAVYTRTETSTMTNRTCEFVATGTSTQVAASMRTTSAVVGSTAIFDNISVREIIGYRDVYTLGLDGANDYLMGATSAIQATDAGLFMACAIKSFRIPPGDNYLIGVGDAAILASRFGIVSPSSGRITVRFCGSNEIAYNITAPDVLTLGAPAVLTAWLVGSSLVLRINGVQVSEATIVQSASAWGQTAIGSRPNAVGSFVQGEYFGGVITSGVTTLAQAQKLEAYLAKLAGVAL